MPTRRVLWLVTVLLAVHNAEEALFFPRYLPLVLARLPRGWQALAAPLTTGQVWSALAVWMVARAVLMHRRFRGPAWLQ